MRALARIHPPEGIAAMQSINRTVIHPSFLSVFVGTALGCLVLSVFALLQWDRAGAPLLLSGSLLYLVGTFLVTIAFNVPLNDALDAVEPRGEESARVWARYLVRWTAWNHVRTAAALAAAAVLTLAL